MQLPNNESVFDLDLLGDTTFKKYDGRFTVRCVLNVGQKILMESEKARMMGGSTSIPTDTLIGLSEILATLRAKIIDAPEWWKQSAGGSTLSDENVLLELYKKVNEAEMQWRQKVKELADPPKDSTSPNP